MLNLTLTITAAPELLAAISSFTSAITAARVVTIPDTTLEFKDHNAAKEQATAVSFSQPAPQKTAYQEKNPSILQGKSGTVYPAQGQLQATSLAPLVHNQAPAQTAPTQGTVVPTSAQSYTLEQLAVAATQIVDAGHRAELVSLLNSFRVQALTALPKEQYGAFATSLRALGAKL